MSKEMYEHQTARRLSATTTKRVEHQPQGTTQNFTVSVFHTASGVQTGRNAQARILKDGTGESSP
jgi:hypothetical protein